MRRALVDGRTCLVLDDMTIFVDSLAAVMQDGNKTVFEFKHRDFTSYAECDYQQVLELLGLGVALEQSLDRAVAQADAGKLVAVDDLLNL